MRWSIMMALIIAAVILALTGNGCAGFTDARRVEIDHRGYCFSYLTKGNRKQILYCADSKFTCEGMRKNTNNAGYKVTSECSLY